jgi:hypothetical protein
LNAIYLASIYTIPKIYRISGPPLLSDEELTPTANQIVLMTTNDISILLLVGGAIDLLTIKGFRGIRSIQSGIASNLDKLDIHI